MHQPGAIAGISMLISVKSDVDKAVRLLGVMGKQIPFAASLAMNDTITQVQKVEKAAAKRELDNPRPNTIKGIRISRSNKRNLRAAVFVIPAVDSFLRYQVQGGTRSPRGRAEAVPVSIKLNRYGNISGRRGGKLAKLLKRPDTFSGVVKGVAGIWQRGNGRNKATLKLLVAYEERVIYKPRYRFYYHAERTVDRVWSRNFIRSIKKSLVTA